MSTNNTTSNGFIGLLTIVFITLKLTGYITWSWWWVLSPLWISAILGMVAVGLYIIFFIGKGDRNGG